MSTIRYRSFKTFDLKARRPYRILLLFAGGLALITMHPRAVLVSLAYFYLASAFIGMVMSRFRPREDAVTVAAAAAPDAPAPDGSSPPASTPQA